MNTHTYYTAVGHFRRKTNALDQSYPVIIINQQEYCVDIQEMALWTALNWRLLDFPQVRAEYEKLEQDCVIPARRTLEDCLGRLCTRGLVASGRGETDFEALFQKDRPNEQEAQVMAMSRQALLSTAELIQCTEKGKARIKDSEDLMDCLYREDGSDCDGIVTDCRTSETRFPVLAAVANLYLKQQVTFQIL